MDTCVASTFWVLWIMLPWIWMCKYPFEILFSIILGVYSEVELLDHMINLFFDFLRNCHTVYLSFSVCVCVWIAAILISVRWHSIVVLICGCLYILFGEMFILQAFCPFFNWVVWFFCCCWIVGVLYIFWILTPYQIHNS